MTFHRYVGLYDRFVNFVTRFEDLFRMILRGVPQLGSIVGHYGVRDVTKKNAAPIGAARHMQTSDAADARTML